MRADRLVATLLLLQARGTVTAREVAAELEVSERTARRDLEALGTAGIPVYSSRGYRGGWRLLGGARTDLTGLRAAEAEALLMMAAVAGRASPDFTSAMQKLVQALPGPIRADAELAMASVTSDEHSWQRRTAEGDPSDENGSQWLDPLRRATNDRHRVELVYDARKGTSTRTIEPLGLVAKRRTWYLLANTADGHRTFRLDQIRSIERLAECFEAPASFDLDTAWKAVTERFDTNPGRATTRALVDPSLLAALRGAGIETVLVVDARDSRVEVTLSAWSTNMLAEKLVGLIHHIDLIDPPPDLSDRLSQIGTLLVSRFGQHHEPQHHKPQHHEPQDQEHPARS